MAEEVAARSGIEREHQVLLEERYDLADHPAQASRWNMASRCRKACASRCGRG
jgi:hypothetical protein